VQMLPIDLTSLVAVVLGISIVLIPVIGLTARYALSPTVEAFARLFETKGNDEAIRILERRMELQEQEIAMLSQTVRSLNEAQEFERKLAAPPSPPTQASRSESA
jgi:hypothetical protein